jgi:hypothetical protein
LPRRERVAIINASFPGPGNAARNGVVDAAPLRLFALLTTQYLEPY